MDRLPLSDLNRALRAHGVRIRYLGNPHRLEFHNEYVLLFTVSPDDLFDGDGNRFDIDLPLED